MRDILDVDSSSASESSDDDILFDLNAPPRNVRQRTTNRSGRGNARGAPRGRGRGRGRGSTRQGSGRVQMGGFLNTEGTGIRGPNQAAALIGLIQLAGGHENGILATLGHSNRTDWIRQNIQSFFRSGGPLSCFHPVSEAVVMRHLRHAQAFARTIYERDHNNDPTGAGHEDIPQWVREFFLLFEAQQNQETATAAAARVRSERGRTVASIAGRQAPLGVRGGSEPAEVRTETSTNHGAPHMRARTIGGVNSERVNVGLVEGRDDNARRSPAPRQHTSNGTRRRNVHQAGFGAGENDPSTRFRHIQDGYASLNRLTDAIAHSFVTPIQETPRLSMLDLVRGYAETSRNLANTSNADEQNFYRAAQRAFHAQLQHQGGTAGGGNAEGGLGDESGGDMEGQ